jgi:hypothetical protein
MSKRRYPPAMDYTATELRERHREPGYTGWKFFAGWKVTLIRVRYEAGYPVELASLYGRGQRFGWWEQTLDDLEVAYDSGLGDMSEAESREFLEALERDWILPDYGIPAPDLFGPTGDMTTLLDPDLRYGVGMSTTAVTSETMMGPRHGPVDVR